MFSVFRTSPSVILFMLAFSVSVFCSEDSKPESSPPDKKQSTIIELEGNSEMYPDPILRKIFTYVSPIIVTADDNKRDFSYDTHDGNDIPFKNDSVSNDITVSSAKKVAKFLLKKLAKKNLRRNEVRPQVQNAHGLEIDDAPVLGFPIFEVGESFYSVRQKYIEDSIRMIPPFPELHQRSIALETERAEKDFQKGGRDVSLVRHPDGLTNTKSVQLASAINGKDKNEKSIISLLDQPTDSQGSLFNRNDEQLFESFPLRKYKEIQTMSPFEELHIPSRHKSDIGVESESKLIITIEKTNPRSHAGPDLYPSSIFERELRVPFF